MLLATFICCTQKELNSHWSHPALSSRLGEDSARCNTYKDSLLLLSYPHGDLSNLGRASMFSAHSPPKTLCRTKRGFYIDPGLVDEMT